MLIFAFVPKQSGRMQQINLILRYLRYQLGAIDKFGIHSPFVYDLVTQVLEDSSSYGAYKEIEQLKKDLLQKNDRIEVTDYGAGSKADKQNIRSIRSLTKHSSKPKKYGRLLYRLARYLKPGIILELGTAMGLSSAYLSKGFPESSLTTLEGCPNISEIARTNLNSLGLDRAEVITGPFDDTLPSYLNNKPQLDLVFIDGNHKELPTLSYFEQCVANTVNTSCIVLDDIHWTREMEKAWQTIQEHPAVTLSIDLFFMGLVFFRKELTKQHFVIRF
jgi:predicted O-methyltransferase YrrM